jgi:hypothetical protein
MHIDEWEEKARVELWKLKLKYLQGHQSMMDTTFTKFEGNTWNHCHLSIHQSRMLKRRAEKPHTGRPLIRACRKRQRIPECA